MAESRRRSGAACESNWRWRLWPSVDWCWDCAGFMCRGPRWIQRQPTTTARQVTVFGIIATPGSKTADSNLASIKTQLDKLLPKHGFRLLDAQSKRIVAGEIVTV